VDLDEQTFLDLTRGLDLDAFWGENETCLELTPLKPRCPLNFSPDDHWLFGCLPGISTLRYYREKPYRDALHLQANRMTLQAVGKSFFEEDTWETSPKRIENLFGCEFTYTEGATPWLTPVTNDPAEFAKILDQAERTEIEAWAIPLPFRQEWEKRKSAGDTLPELGTGCRGPATIMTSVLHPETVVYWMIDLPDLMVRFRDLLAQKMVELNRILRGFSGYAQPGWWITDDNCALFNRRYYQEYCIPILKIVLDEFAPPGSRRYQHSDSAMAHLLEDQRGLGINDCNYGPTVDAGLIRQKLPEAIIQGQLPPMLLRNGSPETIRARVRSDFAKAGSSGRLFITTAGSLSSGTSLGRMRWLMKVVQEDCRY
jgi:uroporphyrinogen decarboxylase